MEKDFRSRGIRFMRNTDHPKVSITSKIYYDASAAILSNSDLKRYVDIGSLEYFEFSADEQGNIDTYNFHNNLMRLDRSLYADLSKEQLTIINDVPNIFDQSFRNYTIGYRVRNNLIQGRSYYFYPTIEKVNRYGIRGTTDVAKNRDYIEQFIKYLKIEDDDTRNEIIKYTSLFSKFKGISVTFCSNRNTEYKIYAKVDTYKIYDLLEEKMVIDRSLYEPYGDVVLAAIRISMNKIIGYNLYYLA